MAADFPFMKYIFLLSLFIISFTLMYSTTLELLGLGLFFVVNLMYSAMLGNDLFSFFGRSYSGVEPANRWTMGIAVILLIALSMNFTSSILTMMTLTNLRAKFGKKGEKLLLSPEYRKELSAIEGMFVATIVLITVLSFRIYMSPSEMAEGVFEWFADNVPSNFINYGHFGLCVVVMGLGLGLFSLIDRRDLAEKTKNCNPSDPDKTKQCKRQFPTFLNHPFLPDDFLVNFKNLFWVLITIFLFYFLPTFIPIVGYATGIVMPNIEAFYTSSSISTFTLFKTVFVPLTLAFAVELNKMSDVSIFNKEPVKDTNCTNGNSSSNTDGIQFDGYEPLVLLGIITMIISLLTLVATFGVHMIPSIGFLQGGFNLVDGLVAISILIAIIVFQDKNQNIFDAPNMDMDDTLYIYHKLLTSFLFLFPVVFIGVYVLGVRELGKGLFTTPGKLLSNPQAYGIWKTIENVSKSFLWNAVDSFWAIKTFLVAIAVVFAGLTINSYNNIPDVSKYNNYYHLKEVFGSFIAFLIVVLSMSLFDTKSIPRLLTFLIEYLSPVAILIMIALLVFYSNHMSKLANKELIGGVESEPEVDKIPDKQEVPNDRADRNVFDGIAHKI